MAIWHGNAGGIRLYRSGTDGRVYDRINPADVDAASNRFSLLESLQVLTPGDRVWIRRVEEDGALSSQPLDIINAWSYPDWQGYVSVDGVGSIRLYESWEAAVVGSQAGAISLRVPVEALRVSLDITNSNDRFLAQVTSYSLSTNRTLADSTQLGADFAASTTTLMGGSGAVNCFFDFASWSCDDLPDGIEKASLLHRLALRQQAGASFRGVFLLKRAGSQPMDLLISADYTERELFYEADCIIQSVECEISTDDAMRSVIQFVTTGPVVLKYDLPLSSLLMEASDIDRILTEGDNPIDLEFL